jgi:hypothetical protein
MLGFDGRGGLVLVRSFLLLGWSLACSRPAFTCELSYLASPGLLNARVVSGHIYSRVVVELALFRTIEGRRSTWKREIRDELSTIKYYRHGYHD